MRHGAARGVVGASSVEHGGIARAEPRLRLLEGRQRLAVGRVRGEIRPSVVGVLDDDDLLVADGKRLVGAERVAVIEPDPAAHRGRVVQLEGEADPRLEVGLVGGTARPPGTAARRRRWRTRRARGRSAARDSASAGC